MTSSRTAIDSTYAADIAKTAQQSEFAERAFLCLFVLGMAWVPFWYGSNDLVAWGVNAVLFPGLVAVYEASLLIRGRRHPVGVRAIAAPAVLFAVVVVWVMLQTCAWVPVALINPIWGMAADALGRSVAGSISVNRDLTTLALLRLVTAACAFWLALQLCRDGARAIALIGSLAAIVCGYAVYGLVVLKTGQVPWLDTPAGTARASATFVNHNSFAAYAGIGFIALVGLIVRRYRDEVIAGANWRLLLASIIDVTGRRGGVLLGGGFVILVALLMTGSRGGVISTLLGLCVLGFLMFHGRTRRGQWRGPALLGMVLIAATAYLFGGIVFGNLEERGVTDASRISVYLLTLRSILDAPLLGYGYGTFSDAFPMYRDRSISVDGIWGQAHDTYLEVLQGLGLVFGSMLIASVMLLALRCAKGALRRQENAIVPATAAGAACLVGVHSLIDFSLQMQAVALTFMAVLGAGVAQSESSRRSLED